MELKCNDSITNLEIGIFSKIPWHVIGIFPDDIVFIESKRRAGIDKATMEKYQILVREEKVEDEDPSNARRSPIVPTVKSAMKYIP